MPIFLQILLSVVVVLSTFLITVAAFHVFHILHDFRLTLKKLNNILDNTQTLSEASAKPITAFNQFFSEVKTLVNTTQEEIISSTPDRVITPPKATQQAQSSESPDQPTRRFFKRSGQFLRSN